MKQSESAPPDLKLEPRLDPKVSRDGASVMLFDAARIGSVCASWFEPDHWRATAQVRRTNGGRGSAWFINGAEQDWVLRHYQRGGLVAKLFHDQYLFTGAARTRAFSEWRLLSTMAAQGLPVPRPVAARYQRSGLFYRADLLIEQLPNTRTLAQNLADGSMMSWAQIGACVRRFHDAGIDHADLNAHNILLDSQRVFLIDFDRGARRAVGRWQQANLDRLQRSLRKLSDDSQLDELAGWWEQLLSGYAA